MRYGQVNARVAQLVERDLAKVEAAGSSPVSRSWKKAETLINTAFPFFFVSANLKTVEDSL